MNECSSAYKTGEWIGVAASVATGYAAGTKALAKAISPVGHTNFSHTLVPQRALRNSKSWLAKLWNKSGNRLNGDYLPTTGARPDLHDFMDSVASKVGMTLAGRASFSPWSRFRQAINRIPYTPAAAVYAGGSYALNELTCECK